MTEGLVHRSRHACRGRDPLKHEILYQPSYSLLRVELAPGETVDAEGGAMVSMSPGIRLETTTRGGVLSGLKRAILGGESFFMNRFTADDTGEVTFAPALPGDIASFDLTGRTLFAQSGAYIASGAGVEVDTKWGGAKTFFSGEGFFLLKLSGTGPVWFSSFGALHPLDLKPGEKYIVDSGHVVAFEESVGYDVRRVGGLKSTLFSGEGLVVELTGPGRAWLQTRSQDAFLSWLKPLIPGRQQGESRGGITFGSQ